MKDECLGWRNHRWSYDAEYCEREAAPLLANLISSYGYVFDDIFIYQFQGKKKQYIIRFPHYGGARANYRIPMEHPKDPFQSKLNKKGELEVPKLLEVKS
jgi:hypothetical protein